MSTPTRKKGPATPSADAAKATAAAHENHESKVKAKAGTPKKHDGASLFKECQAQGIYPSFAGGKFEGYLDKQSKRKVTTTLPEVSDSLHNDYIKAEKEAMEAAAAKKSGKKVKAEKLTGDKPKGRIDGAKKIKILVAGNPRREGSTGFTAFKNYKNGMTVADYLEAKGSHSGHLRWDVEHGYISLS